MTEKLKVTNPRNYYKVVKMLSGYSGSTSSDCDVEELRDLTASDAAESIAAHFSAVSCSYQPVQLASLPAYLPASRPPQVTELQVYSKLNKLKHTRSTFPNDLPYALRKEYCVFIAAPLTDIFNTCFLKVHFLMYGNWSTSHQSRKFHTQKKFQTYAKSHSVRITLRSSKDSLKTGYWRT